MLEITRITQYPTPGYPGRGRYTAPPKTVGLAVRNAAALTALAALLDSCGVGPTTGLPPVQIVSESEARTIIGRFFTDNQIPLQSDIQVQLPLSPTDTVPLNLDGFNDSTRVGYEYVTGDDFGSFTSQVIGHLDSTAYTTDPHILVVPEMEGFDVEARLETAVQAFVDSLRAHGII